MNQEMYRMLELDFPYAARDGVEFIDKGDDFMLVKLNDGRSLLYDALEHTTRLLPRDSHAMTEEECRREFRSRLRKWMRRKGMSQLELSERTGISQVVISRYASGKSMPGFYAIDKIAKALDCSVDDFRYFD